MDASALWYYSAVPAVKQVEEVRHAWRDPTDLEESLEHNTRGYYQAWLGMRLDEGRYIVVRKLGLGSFASVWLAQDSTDKSYVAIKILTVEATELERKGEATELTVTELIAEKAKTSSHPGRLHVARYYRHFRFDGPQGAHLCLVFEALCESPLVTRPCDPYLPFSPPLPPAIVRTTVKQALLAFDFLHTECRVAHRDLSRANAMHRPCDLGAIIPEALMADPSHTVMLRGAKAFRRALQANPEAVRADYPVGLYYKSDALPRLVVSQPLRPPRDPSLLSIVVNDFGLAAQSHELDTRGAGWGWQRSPEVLCGQTWSLGIDIWTIGLLTVSCLTGKGAFSPPRPDVFGNKVNDAEHAHRILQTLGLLDYEGSDAAIVALQDLARSDTSSIDDELFEASPMLIERLKSTQLGDEERPLCEAFLRRCFTLDPAQRPDAAALLDDPWLSYTA